jgi:hypothetical protein
LEAGAVHDRAAEEDPAVALRPVGAPGAVAPGVTAFDVAVPFVYVALIAVTVQVIALDTSPDTTVYVEDVAPEIGVPARFHWYVYESGVADQVPFVVVRTVPVVTDEVGVTAGATVFVNANAADDESTPSASKWCRPRAFVSPVNAAVATLNPVVYRVVFEMRSSSI